MKTPAEQRLEAATHAINTYQHQHPYANLQDKHLAALWADRSFAEKLVWQERQLGVAGAGGDPC